MAREMMAVVGISGVLDKSVDTAIQKLNKKLSGINPNAVKIGAVVASLGTAAVAAAGELSKLGDDYNKAMNDLQAKTGASKKEMQGLGDVVKGVYKNNFGESMGDVSTGVATIKQQTGLAGKALQKTTEDAFALRDTFEYDISESSRAAKAMMINMGTSGEKAMGLIAAGAQNGLDYSGELLDSVSEYSVQFGKLGFNADQMFSVFQEGADTGAWNLDKVGDAVKEFSIRSIDGSQTTTDAYKKLGFNADDMMQKFAKGGDTANQSFKDVVSKLMDMDDAVERDQVGVALFGTMWEDLGTDAIQALAKAEDKTYDTKDALEQIKNTKYDNMGSAMEGIRRTLEVGLLPAASALAHKLADLAPKIEGVLNFAIDHMDVLIPLAGGLAGAYGLLKFANLINGAKGLTGAFKALSAAKVKDKAETLALHGLYLKDKVVKLASATATKTWAVVSKGAALASRALGAAIKFMSGPIGWIVTGIGLAITAGIALYKNWDTVKAYAIAFAIRIKAIFVGIKDKIVGAFSTIKSKIGAILGGLASIVKSPINAVIGIVNKLIDTVNTLSFDIPDWVPEIGGDTIGFNIPHLNYLATGGFTSEPSIAGEAGTEAVISFDRKYRNANVGYWQQAGRMLGVDDYSLSGNSGGTVINMGAPVFSPTIKMNGSVDEKSLMARLKDEYMEFLDMLEELGFELKGGDCYEQ